MNDIAEYDEIEFEFQPQQVDEETFCVEARTPNKYDDGTDACLLLPEVVHPGAAALGLTGIVIPVEDAD